MIPAVCGNKNKPSETLQSQVRSASRQSGLLSVQSLVRFLNRRCGSEATQRFSDTTVDLQRWREAPKKL